MSVRQMIASHKMREGARDGGRDGRAESGGMAAKKLEPHAEMWGKKDHVTRASSGSKQPSHSWFAQEPSFFKEAAHFIEHFRCSFVGPQGH